MRDYEIVYIFRSSLTSEEIEGKLERYHSIITTEGEGEITASAHWGKRPFAYPIKKQRNGYYVVVQFSANPASLQELERVLKLEEDVLRYLIVLSEPPLPPLETEDADAAAEADEAAAESPDEASDEATPAEGDAESDDPEEAEETPAPEADAAAEDDAEEAPAGEDIPDGEGAASEEEEQTETEEAGAETDAETDADAGADEEEE